MIPIPEVQKQVKFCAHYLIEHGIDTPNKFLRLIDSLSVNDQKYGLFKIVDKDEMFMSMATQLKQLWPTGTREINGKRYPWQDSAKNLMTRLKQVWNTRDLSKYTIDDVLQCARQYLSDFENDTKFMLSLPYWILKDKTIGTKGSAKKVYVSKMADLLEGKTASEEDGGWGEIFADFKGMGEVI